jgi:GlcNAc-P-P-Und epimerase
MRPDYRCSTQLGGSSTAMSKDAVVVLGASGFIGTRLVRHLVQRRNLFVRALDIAPPRERLEGAEYHTVDVRKPIPDEYGRRAQTIFNLAAVHRTPGHPEHEYFETNVAGALNATVLAERCDIGTIVFTSSISVYGPCEHVVTEQSELKPTTSYGRSKILAEQIHNQWQDRHPANRLITVRPGVVFGPGERGNYTYLARALRRGYFMFPGRRDVVKSGGYVDELIRAIEFALEKNDRRILFNFAYPSSSTTQEIVDTFGKVTGRSFRPLTLPLAPMMIAASLIERARILGIETPVHPQRVMKLVQSTKVAPGWLEAEGYEFSTDLTSALQLWHGESGGSFA